MGKTNSPSVTPPVDTVKSADQNEPKNKPAAPVVLSSSELRALPVDKLTIDQALQLASENISALADQFETARSVEMSAYRAAVLQGFAPYASLLWNDKGAGRPKNGCLEKMISRVPSADPSTMSICITVFARFGQDAFMGCGSIRACRRLIEERAKLAQEAAQNAVPEAERAALASAEKRTRAIRHLQEAITAAVKAGLTIGEVTTTVMQSLAAYAPKPEVQAPVIVPSVPSTDKPRSAPMLPMRALRDRSQGDYHQRAALSKREA